MIVQGENYDNKSIENGPEYKMFLNLEEIQRKNNIK